MALTDVTSDPLPTLAPREADSHKGTHGRVAIIGGSRGMAGAPALSAMAALRSGAGLVTILVPREIQSTVASFEAAVMTVGLGESDCSALRQEFSREIIERVSSFTAVALGPGIGTDPGTMRLVHELYHRLEQPLVVDADALNALAEHTELLQHAAGPRILTPHPGEFKRLMGEASGKNSTERAEQAASLARQDSTAQTVVVLKGHETVVADGQQFAINQTGNPGMATGGTGDCLTGIIAALVGQGLSPWQAARLGAHLHGLAGDLAAEELGEVSMIASDLVDYLPEAFQSNG